MTISTNTIDAILNHPNEPGISGNTGNYDKVYVLDTNIILEDANNLFQIGSGNLIILPETVIDELDAKKSGFGEINYQAREFGRILSNAKNAGIKEVNNLTILELELNLGYSEQSGHSEQPNENIQIHIVQLNEDSSGNSISDNDKRIIQIAKESEKFYGEIYLLSNDVMCRTRALMQGLKSSGLQGTEKEINPEFIKTLEVPVDLINLLDGMEIQEVDAEYEPFNYCYHFTSEDGNQKLGYVVNSGDNPKITIIEDESFKGFPVLPLNMGQRFALTGMADPRIDIAVVEARAGAGKNLLAIAAGMKMVQEGTYDKIIYIRNSIESTDKSEEVGFLPGLESKFEIYNYPLMDTLEFISQYQNKQFLKTGDNPGAYSVQDLIDKYSIETMWNGAIRGRTLSRAFVIIDEAQNFSKKSLQTVITRLDKECKLVLIGSNRQIDNSYITKHTNGLSVILNSMNSEDNEVTLFGTELNKVVRGKITEYAERIFEFK